jgi:acyl-coenzyme A synthetase/AMP-(fatty) acid ligase
MRKKTIFAATATLALVAMLAPLAFSQEGSIAAAARQRSSDRKAKRVITDEDMPQRPAEKVSPAPAPSDPAATEASAPKVERIVELQQKLEEAKFYRTKLEQKLQALEEKARKTEDENHRRMYRETIENQQTTLVEFDRQRQELEKQIAAEQAKQKQGEAAKP